MAAPSYSAASTGSTDAGGAWLHTIFGSAWNTYPIGSVCILQVLQDGTSASTITLDSVLHEIAPTSGYMEDLSGTDDVMTFIGTFSGGGCKQHLWIGRKIADAGSDIFTIKFSGSNSGTDDLYMRLYVFTSVNTGSTLSDVIENGTAGGTASTSGTSATIADAGVTTLGPDRLALNFVGGNDDNALDAFTGMSGGTWAEAVAEYAESSGTDGVIGLQTASMASAGTIDGGTDGWADATDGWGVVGFALIGTTAATAYAPPFDQNIPVRMRL